MCVIFYVILAKEIALDKNYAKYNDVIKDIFFFFGPKMLKFGISMGYNSMELLLLIY